MSVSKFRLVSFVSACLKMEQSCYFLLAFRALDDEADTYATLLEQYPDIAEEFITPDNRYHLLLIEKTPISKKVLLEYPRTLNTSLLIDYDKWENLFLVAFDGEGNIFQAQFNTQERIQMVNMFKSYHSKLLKRLWSNCRR